MSRGVRSSPKRPKYGVCSVYDISKSSFKNFSKLMDIYSSDSTLILNVKF